MRRGMLITDDYLSAFSLIHSIAKMPRKNDSNIFHVPLQRRHCYILNCTYLYLLKNQGNVVFYKLATFINMIPWPTFETDESYCIIFLFLEQSWTIAIREEKHFWDILSSLKACNHIIKCKDNAFTTRIYLSSMC